MGAPFASLPVLCLGLLDVVVGVLPAPHAGNVPAPFCVFQFGARRTDWMVARRVDLPEEAQREGAGGVGEAEVSIRRWRVGTFHPFPGSFKNCPIKTLLFSVRQRISKKCNIKYIKHTIW